MSRPLYILSRSTALQDETYGTPEGLEVRLKALVRQANGGREGNPVEVNWAILTRPGRRPTPCLRATTRLLNGHRMGLGYIQRDGWAQAFLDGMVAALDLELAKEAA